MPEFRDNKSRITAWGKKEEEYREKKKKEKANFVTPVKKIKRYAIRWSKKQNPTAKCCNATITKSAQYQIEPITKIKSRVGTILLQFCLKWLLRVPSTDIYIYIYSLLANDFVGDIIFRLAGAH